MAPSSTTSRPLVSWLIPTTLYHHRWWKRLVEYLEDDFPPQLSECIFLGTQDREFTRLAQGIGQRIVDSLAFRSGVVERWKNVRFIESYSPEFNICTSRNRLLEEATGDIVIHRDCDTALVQYNFTAFTVKQLLSSRLGMLSYPSLQNGVHFKPTACLPTMPHPDAKGVALAPLVQGMAVATLRSVEHAIGGHNTSLAYWGEYNALGPKLANSGFLMGHTTGKYWLSSTSDESSISLTDHSRNSEAKIERAVGIAIMNDYYQVTPDDTFWKVQRPLYGVDDTHRSPRVAASSKERYPDFAKEQRLAPNLRRYNFKPWECLSHADAAAYIKQAHERAEPFFAPVEKRVRELGLDKIFATA